MSETTTNNYTDGRTQDTTPASFLSPFIEENPFVFFGLFIGATLLLISIIAFVVYKKISTNRASDSSDCVLRTSTRCDSIEACPASRNANIDTSEQNLLPSVSQELFLEEDINEAEADPEYDYPELFQFRLQLETFKKDKNREKAITEPPKPVHTYVNVNQTGDLDQASECQYLIPRQPVHEGGVPVETEEALYDIPTTEYEIIWGKGPSGTGHGYVGVKAEVLRGRPEINRLNSPQQHLISELQKNFQRAAGKRLSTTLDKETIGKTTCRGTNKKETLQNVASANAQSQEVRRVRRHHAIKANLPNGKFVKRRYENLPI